MDRRQFLAVAVAGLAGCATLSRDGRSESSPTSSGTDSNSSPEDSTVTPTPEPLDGSWRSFQRDAGNTGATDASAPTRDIEERWHRAVAAGKPATAPLATDGAFVVVSTDGVLYARESADGSVRWLGPRVDERVAPVAVEQTVVATAGDSVIGVDSGTGRERWRVELDGQVRGLAAAQERVVVATTDGVRALSPADGNQHWYSQIGGVATSPGVGPETVAVGLRSGEILALDAVDGAERWRVSLDSDIPFSPAVSGDVYVPVGPRLVALDGETGNRQWTYPAGDTIAAPPTVTADAIYVTTVDGDADGGFATPATGEGTPTPTPTDVRWFRGTVVALSPGDAEERWGAARTERYSFTSGPPEEIPLAIEDGLVLVSFDGRLVAYDAATGEERWAVQGGALRPAVTGGVVSTGTVGVSLASGATQWRLRTGDSVTVAPAILGNTLYVGSEDSYLYAMAADTGTLGWSARLDGPVSAAPTLDEETVYVGTTEGTLSALDRADGSERWALTFDHEVRSPALADGKLYVGTFSGTVRAVDAADGTVVWRTSVDNDRFVALEVAVEDGAVYAGANGVLRAFETTDGSDRWTVVVGDQSRVQSPPIVADGRVYVNIGTAVRAYDTADGTELWTAPIAGNANEPPVVHGGVVYTSSDEAVHAVDAADGTERWRRSVRATLALVVTGDALYGWGHDTPLLALDTADGSELWRDGSFEPSSPLAVADGHLFVGDRSGSVRALGPRRE